MYVVLEKNNIRTSKEIRIRSHMTADERAIHCGIPSLRVSVSKGFSSKPLLHWVLGASRLKKLTFV